MDTTAAQKAFTNPPSRHLFVRFGPFAKTSNIALTEQ